MLRVVHVDHRAEKLVQFLREVDDVRAFAAAKELRVATHMPDVVVAGERDVAGAFWRDRQLHFFEKPVGVFVAQLGERRLAKVAWTAPELGRRKVDVGDRHVE